jgi:hypothetical protein
VRIAIAICIDDRWRTIDKAGKWHTFSGSEAIVDGVQLVSLHGHTPGHTGHEFSSKGQRILFWGDTIHVQIVQLRHPEIAAVFDIDQAVAAAMRNQLLPTLGAGSSRSTASPKNRRWRTRRIPSIPWGPSPPRESRFSRSTVKPMWICRRRKHPAAREPVPCAGRRHFGHREARGRPPSAQSAGSDPAVEFYPVSRDPDLAGLTRSRGSSRTPRLAHDPSA